MERAYPEGVEGPDVPVALTDESTDASTDALIEAMHEVQDARGVDVAQIRELLSLTPSERLARMVDIVNRLRAMIDHAVHAQPAHGCRQP